MDALPPVLLFDGLCNLCSGAVQFILRHEKAGSGLRFASLQSEAGQKLLGQYRLESSYMDSLVLIEGGKAYTHSAAALRVAAYLRFPFNLVKGGLLLPRFLRDYVYGWIARNRYRWFGKKEECWLPTPALKARFL